MRNNNQYPGFIEGLKANNIASYRRSIIFYANQILDDLKKINLNKFNNLITIAENVHTILNNDSRRNPYIEKLIQEIIGLGESFYSTLNITEFNVTKKNYKKIAISYLNIAKYTKDERVKKISLKIARLLDKWDKD